MTTVLRKGSTPEQIAKILEDLKSRVVVKDGLDAEKFCGQLKLDIDPLKIQQELRDEWG
tara:strand:+ start:459 stop:635 length:177 start_codon:yes stop_codon:yes gene_type:complete